MSPQRPVIAVLGSLNVDLVFYVSHHPLPGETMTSNYFETACGGKGGNQAVARAKLSRPSLHNPTVDVVMIGAVGADSHGAMLLTSLESSGVETDRISISKASNEVNSKTGTAIVTVEESTAQNRIILALGTNNTVSSSHISQLAKITPTSSLLVLQMELSLETTLAAIEYSKAFGIPVLLNPAPAKLLPPEAYRGLTHLIMNETEAALLSGTSSIELEATTSLTTVVARFIDQGVRFVVITLGARGVYYASADGQSGFVPGLKVKAVDTTAAGDTFIGSYAVGFVEAVARGATFDIDEVVSKR